MITKRQFLFASAGGVVGFGLASSQASAQSRSPTPQQVYFDPETAHTRAGALTMPASNAARHAQSPVVGLLRKPLRIPVAPMMRPCSNMRRTLARPMRRPPASDIQRVKSVGNSPRLCFGLFRFPITAPVSTAAAGTGSGSLRPLLAPAWR